MQRDVNRTLKAGDIALHRSTIAAITAALGQRSRWSSLPLIGIGGNAYTFRSQILGWDAVLKVPRYESRPPGEHWLLEHALRKEATILRSVECDHVPMLLDMDGTGRFLYRTFHAGMPLESTNGAMDRRIVLSAVLAAARELFRTFHESSRGCYVIRDLKPRNLVLSPDSQCVILVDVGSVRPEGDMLPKTLRPDRVGSRKWLYWAPEQLLERKQELDRRADYFSLGATAYFILTGQAPYRNSTRNPDQFLSSYLAQYATVTSTFHKACTRCEIPDRVVWFLESCLHPLPSERPTQCIA